MGWSQTFNNNIVKESRRLATNEYAGKNVTFYTVGKKGNDLIRKNYQVVANNNDVFDKLNFENVSTLADEITQMFLDGKYDKIVVVYNQFKNAATQIVRAEQFLPLAPASSDTTANSVDYIFEPKKEDIIMTLIPKMLKTQLYKAIRDSFASEHGARMTAMHKATDNATELRDQLKLARSSPKGLLAAILAFSA